MKNNINIFIWVLALTGLAACAPVNILTTEPAPNFSLANYQTFDFFEVDTESDVFRPTLNERVDILKEEIARELESRGLRRSPGNPDLLVNLGIVLEDKVQTRPTNFHTDPPMYIGQQRYHWRVREVPVGRYQEGTVSVHLVDREKNELVWQGMAEGVVPRRTNRLRQQIARGAEELFSRLPDETPAQ